MKGRAKKAHPEIARLLRALDEAYEKKAWHGPNLKGTLRGVTPRQACFRPAPGRHSVRELVLHAAYWKYAVWRRLTGVKRGSFPLEGSNFFPRPSTPSLSEWRKDRALLDEQHRRLRAAVAALRTAPGAALERHIYGVAAHDVYHAGQIQLLKRLQR
ncbi:MAG: DinB family protein [Thermoanaerobaculia bacterium]